MTKMVDYLSQYRLDGEGLIGTTLILMLPSGFSALRHHQGKSNYPDNNNHDILCAK